MTEATLDRRPWRVHAGVCIALSAMLAGGTDPSTVCGMTISCQTNGREWASPGFALEVDELKTLGVNWVAIHPYAGIHGDGSVTWRSFDAEHPPEHVAQPIRAARERGVSIMIAPHLAYWGSPFSWRGEIRFEDPAARARFWETYRSWIVALAAVAQNADAFLVGSELDGMLADEAEWRGLIASVREVTAARLSYAANWTHFGEVAFWDALDAIGVQAYFPLSDIENPSEADLEQGWRTAAATLKVVSERVGKPVVLTELGYNRSLAAAREPWAYRVERGPDRERAERLQERCLRVALRTLDRERDWLRGAFLWKWFVGQAAGENFLVDTPGMRGEVRAAWATERHAPVESVRDGAR